MNQIQTEIIFLNLLRQADEFVFAILGTNPTPDAGSFRARVSALYSIFNADKYNFVQSPTHLGFLATLIKEYAAFRKSEISQIGTPEILIGQIRWEDIYDKPDILAASSDWADITNKPATFAPSAHGHAYSEITDKPATFAPSAHGHTYSEITEKPATYPSDWNTMTNKPTIPAGSGGIITDNVTYYVATTGSDTTGDGSVSAPWATPAKALSVLGNYRVQEGKTVTIQCDDGTYTFTSSISNLPKGFLLTGKNTYAKTMSSVQSSSGSAGAWTVIINVDNVVNVTTSDYVIISGASGGTNPKYIEGCWDITAVDAVNNRLTIATTHRGASAPASTIAATVTVIKTVFSFIGVSGVSLSGLNSGALSKCVLQGDNTASTHGIYLTDYAACALNSPVGIRNFGAHGIFLYTGNLVSFGVIAISANGERGITARNGSIANINSAILSGNAGIGAFCNRKAFLSAISGTCSGNGSYGVSAQNNGSVDITSMILNANTTYDVHVLGYGYVMAFSATIAGSTSPALNTQGNEYGYIDT